MLRRHGNPRRKNGRDRAGRQTEAQRELQPLVSERSTHIGSLSKRYVGRHHGQNQNQITHTKSDQCAPEHQIATDRDRPVSRIGIGQFGWRQRGLSRGRWKLSIFAQRLVAGNPEAGLQQQR